MGLWLKDRKSGQVDKLKLRQGDFQLGRATHADPPDKTISVSGNSRDELLQLAGQALHEASETGRNRVVTKPCQT